MVDASTQSSSDQANPPTRNWLLAFPAGLPAEFTCKAGSYRLVRQFKHDFFAATGLYEEKADIPGCDICGGIPGGPEGAKALSRGRKPPETGRELTEPRRGESSAAVAPSGLDNFEHANRGLTPPATRCRPFGPDSQTASADNEKTVSIVGVSREEDILIVPGSPRQVVLKIQRRRPFFGIPMGWLGGWLTRHEATIYRDLADLPGVPGFVDMLGPTGFIHDFVPGAPLARDVPVGDSFFDELADLLGAIHARGIAYVDLNKRQNILVGSDGRPYLIDFQISARLGRRGGEMPRAAVALLQKQDWYHFYKHKRRCRPDLMTADDIARSYRVDGWINLHRRISRPYFVARRWFLDRLHLPHGDGAEG